MYQIPKIIHFCWFGKQMKNDFLLNCIQSWKKYLPDYQFMEWTEKNFDINCCSYVYDAYQEKKYAFVSDYVRLWALHKYGGIYFDTDVEVLKNLDIFLKYKAVLGFESNNRVATAIMMFEREHPLLKAWMNQYHNRKFKQFGKLDLTTNVQYLTNILQEQGLLLNGSRQTLNHDSVEIFPIDYFCPYAMGDQKANITNNSYTIHWCDGSWVSGSVKLKHSIIKIIKRIFGTKGYNYLRSLFITKDRRT